MWKGTVLTFSVFSNHVHTFHTYLASQEFTSKAKKQFYLGTMYDSIGGIKLLTFGMIHEDASSRVSPRVEEWTA